MRHRTAITAATGTLLALAPLTACAGGEAPSEAAAAAAPGVSASAGTRFALGEVGEVTDPGGRLTVVALD
ncbi:hypothetical protein AB0D45_31970 [Streptomyces sp. NPDC048352]|uniref:hypothetical protein n=1 Tax=Streptomyces sp. NPDC048352 TaxID=3154718 RepID=UPI00343A6EA0